jgi:hypothetical protein
VNTLKAAEEKVNSLFGRTGEEFIQGLFFVSCKSGKGMQCFILF